ncbi:Calpain-13 [Tupaia chinensis]|uniref:Calpain-13 n=1 Tax=Tupaia chinensis TaxID=246437 RepID=L8Y6V3_TUPCH|nr:Calpain-13 [Tupaia chinensis]
MAHNQESLAQTSVTKFKDQDFNSLRDRCLSRGRLFKDETFPAMDSSIGQKLLQGKNLTSLEWKRPQVMVPPHFILEGASRFDIQQGTAGDCWFLAALGSLTQNPQCLQKILMDQSFSHQYAGIFRFRFWQCGQWVEGVGGARLPVMGNVCLFVGPRKDNQEFWPCLLEKAYAKLLGSYSHLHYGYLPDALVDLTGGVVTSVNLHSLPSELVMAVKIAAKTGSLMTCATPKGPMDGAQTMENGLVCQHAYTVTAAEQIQYKRGWEEIIRLWNPWGNTEWRGRWRDGSREWQETQDQRKNQLYEDKEDGEFCSEKKNKRLEQKEDLGRAEELRYLVCPSRNEQFQQFGERLPPEFFSPFRNAAQGLDHETKRNFTKSLHLSPGTYVVVPSARREEAEFFLRIFLKVPDSSRNLNSNFNLRALKVGAQQGVDVIPMFLLCLQQGLDIDATQLQSLLNQEFLTGPPGDTFSLDECRSIVALMDLKVNGRLDHEEFARLWMRLVHCQHVFQSIQHSGVLLSSDLQKAIENTGIFISSELLGLMMLRYSDNTGRVSFPSLVCFLIRLEAMAKTFRNLSMDGKGLYLTEMENWRKENEEVLPPYLQAQVHL